MPRKTQPHAHGDPVRLQAFLAHSGIASRRHAEELIAGGRVFVNGRSVTAPGTKVTPGVDHVEVEGQAVEVQPITWIALHKPKGYVTRRDDPYGRKTVYELLPEKNHGLFHVGRLDRDSEGVLLLTNDGVLANRMLHPSFGVTKEYWADVEGKPTAEQMHRVVEEGVEHEGDVLRAESVRRLHQTGENEHRLSIVLREGKNREVRRMMDALGHPVHRLIRRRFGPIALGELKPGKWRVVTEAELASVRKAKPGKETAAGGERPPRRGDRGQGTGDSGKMAERPPRRGDRGQGTGDSGKTSERPARHAGERKPRPAEKHGAFKRGKGDGEGPPRRELAVAGGKPRRPARGDDESPRRPRAGDAEKPRRASQEREPDRRPWEASAPRRGIKPGARPPRREREDEETPTRASSSVRRGRDEPPRARRDRDADETPARGPARGRGASRHASDERASSPRRASGDERRPPRRDRDDDAPRGPARGRDSDRHPPASRGAKPRGKPERDADDAAPRGPAYGSRGTFNDRVRAGRDRDEEEARRPSRPGGPSRGGGRPSGGRGGAAKGESPARRGGKPAGGGRPARGASTRDDSDDRRGPKKGGGPRGRR